MNDIFLSYDSVNRAVAQRLADALEALGWSVWWDREIPFGKAFDLVIEEQLNAARCVIVLWSKESVSSRWVKTEAAVAAERERLVPVLIDDVPIPLEFKRIQTAMMLGWNGDDRHPEFVRLVNAIKGMVGTPTQVLLPAKRQAPVSPPSFRWRAALGCAAAAIILALVALVAIKKDVYRPDGGISPPLEKSADAAPKSTQSPAAGASSRNAEPATTGAASFNIKIGDRIGDGAPRPGAGNIETAGAQNTYQFAALAGQRIYFHLFEYEKAMTYLKWKLTDPDGTEIFSACLGCETPGVQTLKKAGTYTLKVGGESDPATGSYRFQLFNVPAPQEFAIKVGDMIGENMPAPGAGTIESPGAENIYKFTVAPGQRIYFHMFEYDKEISYVKWKLVDFEGGEIFDTCLGCTAPGAHTFKKGGAYLLKIGNQKDPSSGRYKFKLFNVPPAQEFSIKVGDTIRENTPGPGAGNIESPGAEDIYKFNAAAGQRVFFQVLEHEKALAYIKWKLIDPEGAEIFSTVSGAALLAYNLSKKAASTRLESEMKPIPQQEYTVYN